LLVWPVGEHAIALFTGNR